MLSRNYWAIQVWQLHRFICTTQLKSWKRCIHRLILRHSQWAEDSLLGGKKENRVIKEWFLYVEIELNPLSPVGWLERQSDWAAQLLNFHENRSFSFSWESPLCWNTLVHNTSLFNIKYCLVGRQPSTPEASSGQAVCRPPDVKLIVYESSHRISSVQSRQEISRLHQSQSWKAGFVFW